MPDQNNIPVLREPTTSEDLDAKIGQPLINALKAALTIGGGVVGSEAGPAGAVGGAGLGNAAGQSLENTYKTLLFGNNAVPSAIHRLPEAAVQGAGAEMGGQVLGKGLNAILSNTLREPVSQQSLKDYLATDNNNILRSEYHGSSEPIMNPVVGKADSTKGRDVFFTSPEKALANNFATLRAYQKMDPEVFNKGTLPQGNITPYFMSKVNTLNFASPVSFEKANEVGQLMGISKDDVTKSILESMNQHGNIDGEHLWEKFAMLRNMEGEYGSPADVGGKMTDILKNAGYRRLLVNMDPGVPQKETVHFFPEEDLYPAAGQRLQALKDKIELNNQQTQPMVSNELSQILGKVLSNKASNSRVGGK